MHTQLQTRSRSVWGGNPNLRPGRRSIPITPDLHSPARAVSWIPASPTESDCCPSNKADFHKWRAAAFQGSSSFVKSRKLQSTVPTARRSGMAYQQGKDYRGWKCFCLVYALTLAFTGLTRQAIPATRLRHGVPSSESARAKGSVRALSVVGGSICPKCGETCRWLGKWKQCTYRKWIQGSSCPAWCNHRCCLVSLLLLLCGLDATLGVPMETSPACGNIAGPWLRCQTAGVGNTQQ